mgnify:CR=1 FL=1
MVDYFIILKEKNGIGKSLFHFTRKSFQDLRILDIGVRNLDDKELKKSYGRAEITSVADYIRTRKGSMDYRRVRH